MSVALFLTFYQVLGILSAPIRLLRSPCPDVFYYEKVTHDGNPDWVFPLQDHRWRGVVKVPPSLPISLRIQLITPAVLPSKYAGRIELSEDRNEITRKINSGALSVIKYYVYFPARVPVPEMVFIEVNSRVVCSKIPAQHTFHTTLTLEHTLQPIPFKVSMRGGIKGTTGEIENSSNLKKGTLNKKPPSLVHKCGTSTLKSSFTPGKASISYGDWPWMVPLFKKTELGLQFLCSSTLVSSQFVVTAAHCVKLKDLKALEKEDIVAFPGRFDITKWTEEGTQPRELSDIFLHPDFNPHSLHSDLALLKFSKPVEFTERVTAVCLWKGNDDLEMVVGKKGVVFGWGTDGLGHKITPTPQLAVMPIVSQEECLRSRMEFLFLTTNRTLCAGFRNGTGPCSGDSGGGLLLPAKTQDGGLRWVLRGIVSLSLFKDTEIMCDVQEYFVFTDVAKYQDWMSERMSVE